MTRPARLTMVRVHEIAAVAQGLLAKQPLVSVDEFAADGGRLREMFRSIACGEHDVTALRADFRDILLRYARVPGPLSRPQQDVVAVYVAAAKIGVMLAMYYNHPRGVSWARVGIGRRLDRMETLLAAAA